MLILYYDETLPPNYTGVVQRPTSKAWYFKGKLHRADGPACEWADGSKEWYREGADGGKDWWFEGLKHRLWYQTLGLK